MGNGLVILTGASGKLGQVMTKHLLTEGWDVLALTKSTKTSNELLKKNKYHQRLKSFGIDLFSENLDELIKTHLDQNSKIYAVIHNARSLSTLKVSSEGITSTEDFIDEFKLGVIIPYRINLLLLDMGLERVIFINSQYGIVPPNPKLYEDELHSSPIQYGVTKAAQIQLSKELAIRFSKQRVLVNSIVLGGIAGRADDQFKKRYSNFLPLERMLNEIELLPAIDFLLDRRNTASTGSSVVVDGGWTIQ